MIEGYLQRKTKRNLYLIRNQTVSVLGMTFRSLRSYDFKTWLEHSAPILLPSLSSFSPGSGYSLSHEDLDNTLSENYTTILNICLKAHEQKCSQSDDEMKAFDAFMQQRTSSSDHTDSVTQTYDLHIEWDVEDFILSGAIMHILCSLEELERGLLRILCMYGTKGGVKDSLRKYIHPILKDLSKSPPEWEEAENSKSLHSVSGRHALLESYGINAEPDIDWNDRLWSVRTDRNTLARAISTMRYPFQSFLQVHYDAYRAVRHLARESLSTQGIVL